VSKRVTGPSFEVVNPHAAGIDIGDRAHFVAATDSTGVSVVRRFDTFTQDLYAIADWLRQCGITTVAMESTGVYWIPLFEVLETRGFAVCLVDTRRLKSVPGRKTDVKDCQWLQQLHTFGLLQSAFRPEDQIVRLRTYLRQRAMLITYASHHIQHMQKAMQQMNIKLSTVLSDITGLTGMSIIQAILDGERDPVKLAELRDPHCKNSEETIVKSLQGHWRDDHLFELRQAVDLYRFYKQKIVECDLQIQTMLESFPDKEHQQPLGAKRTKKNRHTPPFDARTLLFQKTGVDLTTIDGIDVGTAMKVISEIGTDILRWPSEKHFTSWLCLCPGNKKSGGKILSSKTRRSKNRAAAALRIAAQSLERSRSAMGAYFRRMKARLGAPSALTATAHKLARLIYNLLRHGQPYVDIGQEAYEEKYRQSMLKNLTKRASQFGYTLMPINPG
jgi:transposase